MNNRNKSDNRARESQLQCINFERAVLTDSNFSGSDLREANFEKADCSRGKYKLLSERTRGLANYLPKCCFKKQICQE
jgi:uncharacterized protein YjbI with pentapeptide repeats